MLPTHIPTTPYLHTYFDSNCGGFAGQLSAGWNVLYVLVLLYGLLGLAIVCDDYFVASLEKVGGNGCSTHILLLRN